MLSRSGSSRRRQSSSSTATPTADPPPTDRSVESRDNSGGGSSTTVPQGESQGRHPNEDEGTIKSGWLSKQTTRKKLLTGRPIYHKRYFILRQHDPTATTTSVPAELSWYENLRARQPNDSVTLAPVCRAQALIGRDKPISGKFELELIVPAKQRAYVLRAPTAESRMAWVEALQAAIASAEQVVLVDGGTSMTPPPIIDPMLAETVIGPVVFKEHEQRDLEPGSRGSSNAELVEGKAREGNGLAPLHDEEDDASVDEEEEELPAGRSLASPMHNASNLPDGEFFINGEGQGDNNSDPPHASNEEERPASPPADPTCSSTAKDDSVVATRESSSASQPPPPIPESRVSGEEGGENRSSTIAADPATSTNTSGSSAFVPVTRKASSSSSSPSATAAGTDDGEQREGRRPSPQNGLSVPERKEGVHERGNSLDEADSSPSAVDPSASTTSSSAAVNEEVRRLEASNLQLEVRLAEALAETKRALDREAQRDAEAKGARSTLKSQVVKQAAHLTALQEVQVHSKEEMTSLIAANDASARIASQFAGELTQQKQEIHKLREQLATEREAAAAAKKRLDAPKLSDEELDLAMSTLRQQLDQTQASHEEAVKKERERECAKAVVTVLEQENASLESELQEIRKEFIDWKAAVERDIQSQVDAAVIEAKEDLERQLRGAKEDLLMIRRALNLDSEVSLVDGVKAYVEESNQREADLREEMQQQSTSSKGEEGIAEKLREAVNNMKGELAQGEEEKKRLAEHIEALEVEMITSRSCKEESLAKTKGLESELSAAQNDVVVADQKMAAQKRATAAVREDLQRVNEEIIRLKTGYKEARKVNEAKEKEVQQLKAELAIMEAQLHDTNAKACELEEALDSAAEQLSLLPPASSTSASAIPSDGSNGGIGNKQEEIKAKIIAVQVSFQAVSQAHENADRLATEAREAVQTITTEKIAIEARFNEYKDKVQQSESKAEAYAEEVTRLRGLLDEYDVEAEEREKSFHQGHQQLLAQLNEWKDRLDMASAESRAFEGQVSNLQSSLATQASQAQEQEEEAKARQSQMEAEISSLRSMMTELAERAKEEEQWKESKEDFEVSDGEEEVDSDQEKAAGGGVTCRSCIQLQQILQQEGAKVQILASEGQAALDHCQELEAALQQAMNEKAAAAASKGEDDDEEVLIAQEEEKLSLLGEEGPLRNVNRSKTTSNSNNSSTNKSLAVKEKWLKEQENRLVEERKRMEALSSELSAQKRSIDQQMLYLSREVTTSLKDLEKRKQELMVRMTASSSSASSSASSSPVNGLPVKTGHPHPHPRHHQHHHAAAASSRVQKQQGREGGGRGNDTNNGMIHAAAVEKARAAAGAVAGTSTSSSAATTRPAASSLETKTKWSSSSTRFMREQAQADNLRVHMETLKDELQGVHKQVALDNLRLGHSRKGVSSPHHSHYQPPSSLAAAANSSSAFSSHPRRRGPQEGEGGGRGQGRTSAAAAAAASSSPKGSRQGRTPAAAAVSSMKPAIGSADMIRFKRELEHVHFRLNVEKTISKHFPEKPSVLYS